LKSEVQKKVREDKQKHLNKACDEMEDSQRGNLRKVFQITKALTKQFKPHLHCIESDKSDNITDPPGIAARWREYCEDLFQDKPAANKQGII